MDIKLQDHLNIAHVSELKLELESAIASEENILIDISKVQSIDTATLQLLFTFKQQATIDSKPIVWHKPSNTFLATAKLMGLQEILD